MSEACRYCGSSEGELIHPCKCDGSIARAHPRCLAEWVSSSGSFCCEICSEYYNVSKIVVKDSSHLLDLSDLSTLWRALVARARKLAEPIYELLFVHTVFSLNGIICMLLYYFLLAQLSGIGIIELSGRMSKIENRILFLIVLTIDCMPIQLISLLVLKGVRGWQEWVFIHEAEVTLPPLRGQGDAEYDPQHLSTASLDEAMREEENKGATMRFSAQYESEYGRNLRAVKADTRSEGEALLKCIQKVLNNSTPVSFFERKLPRLALEYCRKILYTNFWIVFVLLWFIKINELFFSLNQRLFDLLSRTTLGHHMAGTIARAGIGDIAFFLRRILTVEPSFDDMLNLRMNFLLFMNCPIFVGSVALKLMPSNRWKRDWTVVYILIRGLIVGFSLVFLSLMFMRIPGSLLESSFFVSTDAVTGSMDTSTSWRVLQKNGLVPLVCDSTELKMSNSFTVLKALYTVSRDFIPSGAETVSDIESDVCLNTFDAASCGYFLFHDRGHVHYAAYAARVIWRLLSNRVIEELVNNLLFTMIPVSAVLNFEIVMNRTKLGRFLTEGIYFLFSHLDARTALRIFFELSMVLMLASTIVSWASWTLLQYLVPGSFPVVIGYYSHNLHIIIRTWSKCPNVLRTLTVWRKLSDLLQRAFGMNAPTMGTNRPPESLAPVGNFFAYLSYAAAYFAVTVVLTSLVRYIQLSSNHLWLIYIPLFDLFINLSQLLDWWQAIHFPVDRVKTYIFLFFAKIYLHGLYGLKIRVDGDHLVLKKLISIPSIFEPQVIESQEYKLFALYEDFPHGASHAFWRMLLDGSEVSVHCSRFHQHLPLLYHSFSAKRRRVMYGSSIIHFVFWMVVPFIAGRGISIKNPFVLLQLQQSACLLVPWWFQILSDWMFGALLLLLWLIIEGYYIKARFVRYLKSLFPHCLFYWHIDTVHHIAIPIIIRCMTINLTVRVFHMISVSTSKKDSSYVHSLFTSFVIAWIMLQIPLIRRINRRRRNRVRHSHNVDAQMPAITQADIRRPCPIVMHPAEAFVNQGVEELPLGRFKVVIIPVSSAINFMIRFWQLFIKRIISIARRVGAYLYACWVELVRSSRLYLFTTLKEDDTVGVVFQDYQNTS